MSNSALYLSDRQEYFLLVADDMLGRSLLVTYDCVNNYSSVSTFVSSRSERTVVADALVKAHFPLYLSFEIPYYSQVAVNEDTIKNAVQDYVHSGSVEGNLYAASIIEEVTNKFGVTVQLPFVIKGTLLLPNGKEMIIEYKDKIRVPEKYMLTPYGEYLPMFDGTPNVNNYEVGSMASLQISDTTTRYVLDKQDVSARRIG